MKLAVMGYGTIGSGVVKVLDMNKELIAERAGQTLEVKYILDLREFPGDPHEKEIVHDFDQIVSDEEVEIVVETMGGTGAAYQFVKGALTAGKHVATSNKALVAKYGSELMQIAKEKNVNFFFEASVGGGIPILRTLAYALAGDEVEEIAGILNGTTNYIMTKMAQDGSRFDDVLKEAQQLGYAELDPTDDVEGYDVGRKIAILTSLISGKRVDFEDIQIEGISKITAEDMAYAALMERTIKLLADSKKVGDSYSVMVAPFLLPKENTLTTVNDAFNAVLVKSNALGDSMYYGSGAGSLPTASAVVGDVVDIAKHMDHSISPKWTEEKLELAGCGDNTVAFFVRVKGGEERHQQIEELFGEVSYYEAEELAGEFGFVTSEMKEAVMEEKLAGLADVITRIRLK
jgi:homoserine dehydrogenase